MINPLDFIPKWVLAALAASLLVLTGIQTMRMGAAELATANAKTEAGQAKLETAGLRVEIADANTKAANQRATLSDQALKAKNEATKRENDLRAAADAARSESNGLRDDLSKARRDYDKLSRDAIVERAAAIGEVLGQCADRRQVLSERCDRHVNDLRTLTEAWPK